MTKRVVALIVGAVLCAGFALASLASPASAGTGHTVQAYLTSQAGDYIGLGHPIARGTPTDDAFVTANAGSATIIVSGAETFLLAIFGSDSESRPLAVGVYPNAQRLRAPGHPWLDVEADGRGCNGTLGSFQVLEVSYVGADIASLAVDFEQHCEGATPALFGSIRVNSTIPIDRAKLDQLAAPPPPPPPPPPPTFFDSHPSACPQLTDSVYRLYTAYFLREPDDTGWSYWQFIYGRTPASLETISWSFAAGEEFRIATARSATATSST